MWWINPTTREHSTGYHWSKHATGVSTWTGKPLPLRVSPRDVPHLYMDTGRHSQMDSQTYSHTNIYTTHNDTDRHTDTWKHTSRHIYTYTETHINMHS